MADLFVARFRDGGVVISEDEYSGTSISWAPVKDGYRLSFNSEGVEVMATVSNAEWSGLASVIRVKREG